MHRQTLVGEMNRSLIVAGPYSQLVRTHSWQDKKATGYVLMQPDTLHYYFNQLDCS